MTTTILKITLSFFLFLPATSLAQKFEAGGFTTSNGFALRVGDTLQLGKGTMGKHYKYINYKYVGVPSVMIKKRGPASTENEGAVLFIEKFFPQDGLIVLKGIPYYKFECRAIDAFKSGELITFKSN